MTNLEVLNKCFGDNLSAEDTALRMTLTKAVEECSEGEYTMPDDVTKKFVNLYHEQVKWLNMEKQN